MLEMPALLWERSKHRGKLCLRDICGACVPVVVPVPCLCWLTHWQNWQGSGIAMPQLARKLETWPPW